MSYIKPFDTAVTREHIRVDETRPGRSYRIADFCARLERACDEIDRLRAENEKLRRVRDAAESHLPDLDDLMEPIGGGNPYWHCRICGVTNVELNMGDHSRSHGPDCDPFADLRRQIAASREG